ncbi:hypothetical protein DK846_00390 [Methanospirillum lacunae]|uniref:Uncharacterized protein n=1 Tax=Methanospirillum lacunae TaxID=668570 RepID=A0A2V2N3K8_9EURY|nr:hypothetical protein DK846_00390 [Methanospirillum lacunae]
MISGSSKTSYLCSENPNIYLKAYLLCELNECRGMDNYSLPFLNEPGINQVLTECLLFASWRCSKHCHLEDLFFLNNSNTREEFGNYLWVKISLGFIHRKN